MAQVNPRETDLARIFERQSCVISDEQALVLGFTRRQIVLRVQRKEWRRLLPGAFALVGAPSTTLMWAWAAVLAGPPGTVILGGSAAELWNNETLSSPVTVAVSRGWRRGWTTQQVDVQTLDAPITDVVRIAGLPVSTRLRTAFDVAHLLPISEAQRILDQWLVLGHIDLSELASRVAESRRRGSRQARELVGSAQDGAASFAERRAHRLFRAAGIRDWKANHRVWVGEREVVVDIAFERWRIAVEINGWAYHQSPAQRSRDDQRTADLQMAGWLVLTFTWWDLEHRPHWVVARVRQAIASRQSMTSRP